MTSAAPSRPMLGWGLAALVLAGLAAERVQAQVPESRQVTLFGIVATPGNPTIDPDLASVAAQLRKLLPGHGFKLLGAKSERLTAGESFACDLGNGFVAETELVHVRDRNGKVQLRFELELNKEPQLATTVTTPPNQLFFCDKKLPNGSRLVIGVGAR